MLAHGVNEDGAALAARHPGQFELFASLPLSEFPFETARAVTGLLLTGALDRYPQLSIILPHGGGALPHPPTGSTRSGSS
ncbi:hypothetical protein JK364_47280 [Streptomyces sp. 110]|uniref:Amidohydrolase n=1 Tax=Streptomyces endocoffeicus TaxID=2898945 RepID=A0ABS1Q5A0_9ACTN|nr:hypothetical protein [Streptomyces endocoffeicus]MBL1119856.1 hypothetical protein [Streptomyces endocoffeicus]